MINPGDIILAPVKILGEFRVDSPEHYQYLISCLATAAVMKAQEYPDHTIMPVFKLENA